MPTPRYFYLLLFSLYWAQGLPVGFMTNALPVILRSQGVSLAHIGGFGLLMLPWAIKLFWAPWVDRFGHLKLGHYRSWIIPTQLISVFILVLVSFYPIQALNQPIYLLIFFALLFSLNTAGATQDIATDALAVRSLSYQQQSIGNTIQVAGSRLGFIVGGGALLWALDSFSWQSVFLALAALVLFNTLPILFDQSERKAFIQNKTLPQASGRHTAKKPSLVNFLNQIVDYLKSRPDLGYWFLALISLKITDGLSGPLLKPLLVDIGLSFTQIGLYITMLGAMSALLGAVAAGWLLQHFARTTLLMVFSILKLLSLCGYALLAFAYEHGIGLSTITIYSINAFEDACSALVLVVILSIIMQYSRKDSAGTDFTFQVAVMTCAAGGLYLLSGVVAEWLGYANYLTIICIIGVFCLVPIYWWQKVHQLQSP